MDSATRTDDFSRRRKAKWASYIIGGIIFLIFIILVFLYAILRVRSIKIHLQSVNIEDLMTNNVSMLLKTQVTIKNSNFGHYKFENSTLVLAYRGARVGEAGIGKGLVKARSTKRINIVARVSSSSWKRGVSLDYRASSQKIKLAASAQVTGKVHVLKIIRRKKIAKMNCTMELDTKTQTIVNLHCK